MNNVISISRGYRVEVRLTDMGSTQSFYAEVQQEDGRFIIYPCGAKIDKSLKSTMFSGKNWDKE